MILEDPHAAWWNAKGGATERQATKAKDGCTTNDICNLGLPWVCLGMPSR